RSSRALASRWPAATSPCRPSLDEEVRMDIPVAPDRLRTASYLVVAAALVTAVGAAAVDLRFALLPVAVLLRWSHLHSIRGQSLVGALTPLVKVARDWRTWAAAVSLYTLTGLGVTLAVGAGIGALGRAAGLAERPAFVLAAGLAVALVLAARELGLLR